MVPDECFGVVGGFSGVGVSVTVDETPCVVSMTFLKLVVTFWVVFIVGVAYVDISVLENWFSKLLVSISGSDSDSNSNLPEPSSVISSSSVVVGIIDVRRLWLFFLVGGFELHKSELQ